VSPDRTTLSVFWWAAFVALSIALVLPMWLVTYPPGVDLPQHAAQVAIAVHWFDDALPYRELYEFNPLSQSLIAHGLAYLFAAVVSVVTAMKLVVSLALLAIPLSSLRLIRAVDGDPWWVFATFPVAYSFAFYWGFFNFMVGIPLALLLVSVAVAHVRAPGRRRLIALAALPLVVFLGHVLALVFAGLAAGVVVIAGLRGRDRIKAVGALGVPVPLIALWFIGVQLSTPSSTGIPTILGYGIERVLDLPNHLVGIPGEATYTALGLLAVAGPFIAGARPARFGWRWAPLGAALLLYFGFPHDVMGTAFIYPRFAVFVVPALLIALQPGPGLGPDGRVGRALLVMLALVAAVAVTFRFVAFERESSSFHEVVDRVEPGSRLLGLTYGVTSEPVPYPVYLHWVCWLQVERRAVADFSFAEFFPNRFRYRREHDPALPDHVEWAPGRFRWSEHGGALYDYFLIRNREAVPPAQFAGATTESELVIESGPWSLIRQRR
jgi:hypothetical protein